MSAFCCRYEGSYMSDSLVTDKEDLTSVLLVPDIDDLT